MVSFMKITTHITSKNKTFFISQRYKDTQGHLTNKYNTMLCMLWVPVWVEVNGRRKGKSKIQ